MGASGAFAVVATVVLTLAIIGIVGYLFDRSA
jgi:hypothetical protein